MGLTHLPVEETEQVQNEMIRIAKRSRFKRNAFLLIIMVLFTAVLMFFSWRDGKLQGVNALQKEIDQLNTTVQEQKQKLAAKDNQIKELERKLKEEPAVVTPRFAYNRFADAAC